MLSSQKQKIFYVCKSCISAQSAINLNSATVLGYPILLDSNDIDSKASNKSYLLDSLVILQVF